MAESPVQAAEDIISEIAGGEYEREPVPRKAWLGFKDFIGMYAGEHCAGTELMIGPMFVANGVSAFDLVVGLFIGNLLATLSWLIFTAPIATKARLTLYYQLEKICGRSLVTLYNLANGVMFCFLAGAMITVSTTAVGVFIQSFAPFNMPAFNDIYPSGAGWVIVAGVLGVLIALVAALGYTTVSWFANIAAPWMVLVFFTFGVIGYAEFLNETGTKVTNWNEFWTLASTVIWKGGEASSGTKFTFWHVTFFAWFCNMAMHIGMSDLSVFRFAKKTWYGIAPASGMYVGHYMAWIAASILYALQVHRNPADIDVLPGPMTYKAAGVTGLICVIIAGWTTANPTIYRAGLAFQAIMPRASRFWVTFCTGLLATAAGIFPAVAMKLLGFVALYGLILMPMGAVIFIDFWYARKLGFKPNYAAKSGTHFNIAAGVAWIGTVALCVFAVQMKWTEIFFVSLPGWFIAAGLYIAISKAYQNPSVPDVEHDLAVGVSSHEAAVDPTAEVKSALAPFRIPAQIVSWVSLLGIIVPPFMFLNGSMTLDQVKTYMLIATIVWFVSAPLWMGQKK